MTRSSSALLFCLLLAPIPTIARAGTLCGTVTDRQTSAPVTNAGIFLRVNDAYTGIHGATDVSGMFCIASVPSGTYDIEVRVDDYQVAYLRGVVVTSDVADVDIGASAPTARLAPPTPNPARDRARLRWTLARAERVELSIVDLHGRFVRRWSASRMPAGEHSIDWDLSDSHGVPLDPGLYFVRLRAGELRLVRSLIRIR